MTNKDLVVVPFLEQEAHAKKDSTKVLELPDWKTLLQHFKEGPVEGDLERNQDFILFNRLALVAIRREWWKSCDSGGYQWKKGTSTKLSLHLILPLP